MIKKAQEYYQVLQNKGELNEVFPKTKGSWEKDENKFLKFYEENIKFILDFEANNLNDKEEYFYDGDASLF